MKTPLHDLSVTVLGVKEWWIMFYVFVRQSIRTTEDFSSMWAKKEYVHISAVSIGLDILIIFLCFILSPEAESHSKPASSSGSQWRWGNPEQRCNPHASSNFAQCNPSSSCHRSSYSCSRFPRVQVRGAFPPCPTAAGHLHHRDSSKSFCSQQAILIKKTDNVSI